MNSKLKSLFYVVLFAVLAHNGFGQVKEIDSIKLVIRTSKEDTNKVNSLLLLSKKYFNTYMIDLFLSSIYLVIKYLASLSKLI